MKKTPWKKILSSALTCFVIALAVFLVFRGNYQEILENLSKAPLWGTAVLFALAAAYQAAEAGICMALVRARLPGFSYRDAVGVTFLGVFGNVATCAVGSIPMQSYRLHQCGLTIGHGIGMMTMEYVFHKASIVLYATVMLIWQGGWVRRLYCDHYRAGAGKHVGENEGPGAAAAAVPAGNGSMGEAEIRMGR